jgi:hypothetical protein
MTAALPFAIREFFSCKCDYYECGRLYKLSDWRGHNADEDREGGISSFTGDRWRKYILLILQPELTIFSRRGSKNQKWNKSNRLLK